MKHKRLLLLGLLVAVLSMVTSPVRANIVVLDDLSADYEIQDGDTLIGVLSADIQIYTANTEPITFTLQDAHIRIFDIGSSFDRNCLTIGGDATLLLDGSSELVAPITRACIAILEGATLTIDSETAGELDATPGEQAAAIGTDYFEDGGNLIIKGGRIIANADQHSPGIGAATGRKFGTITIEASEELSTMLRKRGIEHKVLNAKFHEMEAEIVAEAGKHGAVLCGGRQSDF